MLGSGPARGRFRLPLVGIVLLRVDPSLSNRPPDGDHFGCRAHRWSRGPLRGCEPDPAGRRHAENAAAIRAPDRHLVRRRRTASRSATRGFRRFPAGSTGLWKDGGEYGRMRTGLGMPCFRGIRREDLPFPSRESRTGDPDSLFFDGMSKEFPATRTGKAPGISGNVRCDDRSEQGEGELPHGTLAMPSSGTNRKTTVLSDRPSAFGASDRITARPDQAVIEHGTVTKATSAQ